MLNKDITVNFGRYRRTVGGAERRPPN